MNAFVYLWIGEVYKSNWNHVYGLSFVLADWAILVMALRAPTTAGVSMLLTSQSLDLGLFVQHFALGVFILSHQWFIRKISSTFLDSKHHCLLYCISYPGYTFQCNLSQVCYTHCLAALSLCSMHSLSDPQALR